MGRPQARLSLKGRALQLLAQRDQSRVELRAKLLRHAAEEARVRSAAGDAGGTRAENEPEADDGGCRHDEVEALLDWLEANRFLSAERFVESRVHAREARFGNRRIRAELAQHGVAVPPEVAQALAETELQRAAAVRERRFREPPRDASERAAQARFLAGRGFSPEVIQRVLKRG